MSNVGMYFTMYFKIALYSRHQEIVEIMSVLAQLQILGTVTGWSGLGRSSAYSSQLGRLGKQWAMVDIV